jgi:hypothetical protein
MKRLILILCCLPLLWACSSKKNVPLPPPELPRPDWVADRPIVQGEYVGIGVARKSGNSFEHIEQAKRNALNDLVSQIKVSVQANSVQSQLERNRVFSDEFRSFTKLTTTIDLENVAVAATWQNHSEYWIYYRLSIADYQQQKNNKMQSASGLALDHFEKAKQATQKLQLSEAFSAYIRGLEAIKLYLNEPLPVLQEGKQIYLGNELLTALNDAAGSIAIRVNTTNLKGKIGQPVDEELIVTVSYPRTNGKAVRNFPLKVRFSQGAGTILGNSTTDEQGVCRLRIANIAAKEQLQEIVIEPDFDQMLRNQQNYQLWLKAIDPQAIPREKVIISVARPLVFLQSTENTLNSGVQKSVLQSAIQQKMRAEGIQFTDEATKADYLLTLDASVRQGSVNNGMYNSFVDFKVRLTDKQGGERYSQVLTGIRGIQLDYEKASDAAYKKAVTDLEVTVLPKIIQIIYNL